MDLGLGLDNSAPYGASVIRVYKINKKKFFYDVIGGGEKSIFETLGGRYFEKLPPLVFNETVGATVQTVGATVFFNHFYILYIYYYKLKLINHI